MSDRLLVQNSMPMVDVPRADGSTVPGIAISGSFTLVSQRPVMLTAEVTASITPDYATGQTIGGLLRFDGAGYDDQNLGLTVDSVVVSCADSISPEFDIVLFGTEVTLPADQATFDLSDLDLLNVVGVIPVRTADWYTFNDNRVASLRNVGANLVLEGVDLFAALVARGTINLASADALRITLGIRRD